MTLFDKRFYVLDARRTHDAPEIVDVGDTQAWSPEKRLKGEGKQKQESRIGPHFYPPPLSERRHQGIVAWTSQRSPTVSTCNHQLIIWYDWRVMRADPIIAYRHQVDGYGYYRSASRRQRPPV